MPVSWQLLGLLTLGLVRQINRFNYLFRTVSKIISNIDIEALWVVLSNENEEQEVIDNFDKHFESNRSISF